MADIAIQETSVPDRPGSRTEIDALFVVSRDCSVARGQFLFRQDEPTDRVFLIRQGRILLQRHLASGDIVTIHTGNAGELLAEAALFVDSYQCDAQAAEASVVASCSISEVRRTLAASSALSMSWIRRVTGQLHAARTLLELRNIRSADDRVMQHLRLQADVAGEVVIKGRLLDVAAELGLTPEALYRSLAGLARSGLISRERRTIRLSSPSRALF